ncbi:MAG: GxxExxY protein [Candidatus Methylacidiphilales bacterium]
MSFKPLPESLEETVRIVVDCAYKVHTTLGPGLLENVYELCLCHELQRVGIPFSRQHALPVTYKGLIVEAGLRIDILVDNELVLELKAVEHLLPIHHAQVRTYLKLMKKRLGLLINFNVTLIKDGINRVILL